MLRLAGLAALLGAASAHQPLCSEIGADGLVPHGCADPAWVAKFSAAADGPEQVRRRERSPAAYRRDRGAYVWPDRPCIINRALRLLWRL